MTDRFVVRVVVIFLGTIALTIVGGGIWLAFKDHSLPDSLISMGGGALGGLTAFLVSTRTTGDTQPVQVMNDPGDAVPVTPGDS